MTLTICYLGSYPTNEPMTAAKQNHCATQQRHQQHMHKACEYQSSISLQECVFFKEMELTCSNAWQLRSQRHQGVSQTRAAHNKLKTPLQAAFLQMLLDILLPSVGILCRRCWWRSTARMFSWSVACLMRLRWVGSRWLFSRSSSRDVVLRSVVGQLLQGKVPQ